jgi:hypothetical protein
MVALMICFGRPLRQTKGILFCCSISYGLPRPSPQRYPKDVWFLADRRRSLVGAAQTGLRNPSRAAETWQAWHLGAPEGLRKHGCEVPRGLQRRSRRGTWALPQGCADRVFGIRRGLQRHGRRGLSTYPEGLRRQVCGMRRGIQRRGRRGRRGTWASLRGCADRAANPTRAAETWHAWHLGAPEGLRSQACGIRRWLQRCGRRSLSTYPEGLRRQACGIRRWLQR